MGFPEWLVGRRRASIPYDEEGNPLFRAANPGVVQVASPDLTTWNGTKAGAGISVLVAAPGAGKRLVVTAFVLQNESTTALIMRLKSGGTTNGWRCLGQNQGDGLAMTFHAGHEWTLNENESLNLELSDADTCAVSYSYYTESV